MEVRRSPGWGSTMFNGTDLTKVAMLGGKRNRIYLKCKM